ncbi:AAA family ATPase [Haloarcula halophila]|uniref:AAA family ATPase n=1 Tax=Haloarcula TaxID=2237 RepID=UPI0023E43717|nr:MoxR family ATPase [Halomicroarcula sp. DFY41]
MNDTDMDETDVQEIQQSLQMLRREVGKRIVGQKPVIEQLLACLLCDGNALLESTPGLGKTLLIRTVADATALDFSRVQNTPDLMPSDITGTEVISETSEGTQFRFDPGPIFANVVLADEINRATPKTQAALLEAMQEGQVTAGGNTYELPEPFFVLATQNPIEQEGTYPLPEAQRDRFLLKILLDYPDREEELDIVNRYTRGATETIPVDRVLDDGDFTRAQRLVRQMPIADDITARAVELVRATRHDQRLEYGASPRASMGIVLAAKAKAFLEGRSHVVEGDIEAMARPVLRHRIIVDFTAERDGITPDDVVADLL